jgi:hypothetical protein
MAKRQQSASHPAHAKCLTGTSSEGHLHALSPPQRCRSRSSEWHPGTQFCRDRPRRRSRSSAVARTTLSRIWARTSSCHPSGQDGARGDRRARPTGKPAECNAGDRAGMRPRARSANLHGRASVSLTWTSSPPSPDEISSPAIVPTPRVRWRNRNARALSGPFSGPFSYHWMKSYPNSRRNGRTACDCGVQKRSIAPTRPKTLAANISRIDARGPRTPVLSL